MEIYEGMSEDLPKNVKKRRNSTANRTIFKKAQWDFDKSLKKAKKKYCQGKLIQLDEVCTTDRNAFWKYVRKLGPEKCESKIPWETEIDGRVTHDRRVVLERWRSEFERLYNEVAKDYDENFKQEVMNEVPHTSPDGMSHTELNEQITIREVMTVVKNSKNGKAVGIDGVPNELLKNDVVIKLLHTLFVTCFNLKMVPDDWRKAIIHPIPKCKGAYSNPLKYRGLALQSCVFKIFSSVMNNRLVSFLETNNLISEEQNGFRQKHSCQQHLFSIISMIWNNCNKKNKTGILASFIDFRKAFDGVDRDLLYYRLVKLGVQGTMLELIRQIYSDTTNIVQVNELMTNEFSSSKGVLQGNNISPTLFNCFIDGLIKEINNSGIGINIGAENKVGVLAYSHPVKANYSAY